ncbi:MAG: substrate-binding domain-containing protein [Proteobacteria bacterium]|nr:substrate-binding domain-containing protein [Pseudomonadota bacterium]MBU1687936.1 substrate-binding domain-containing protein [Pseudomonadota bacterium]
MLNFHCPSRPLFKQFLPFFLALNLLLAPSWAGAEEVTIGGTGAALGAIKILAETFQQKNPGITVTILPSLGSGGGIKAVTQKAIDIAVTGRPPKEKELTSPLNTRLFGRTPFLFAVNSQNKTIDNVSHNDLVDIITGARKTWDNGETIFVVFRSPRESDSRFIISISPKIETALNDAYKKPGLYIPVNDQENAEYLEKTPGAFGVTTLSQMITEKRSIRSLSIEGISPTPENVSNNSYPYFKSFYVVTRAEISGAGQKFLDFIFSDKGKELLAQTGHAIN